MRWLPALTAFTLATAPLSLYATPAAASAIEPTETRAPMRVVVVPPVVEGSIAPSDVDAIVDAARRGLASDSYALVDQSQTERQVEQPCKTAVCRHALAQRLDATHVIEMQVRAESRSYAVEMRVYGADAAEPFATAAGSCDICGIAEVEQLVAAKADGLRQRLTNREIAPAVVAVSSTPTGSVVRIDGKQVGLTPYSGEITPGEHLIEVVRSGFFTERKRMTAARGVRERVHVSLAPVPNFSVRRIVGWSALGVGLASLAGGATLLALDGRDYGPKCREPGDRDADGDCKSVHKTLGGGIALTVAGATLTATGVTLLLVDRKRNKTYPLRASVSPKRVALSFKF